MDPLKNQNTLNNKLFGLFLRGKMENIVDMHSVFLTPFRFIG
jgi:hypothetical protein